MAAIQPCLFRHPYRIGVRDWALKTTTARLLAPHRVLHRELRLPLTIFFKLRRSEVSWVSMSCH